MRPALGPAPPAGVPVPAAPGELRRARPAPGPAAGSGRTGLRGLFVPASARSPGEGR